MRRPRGYRDEEAEGVMEMRSPGGCGDEKV